MVVDGARAEGEASGDLAVGGSLGGHTGDQELLGGEAGGRIVGAGARGGGRGAQGAQFGTGLGRAVRGAEGVERLQGAVQAVACLQTAAQSAQGAAEQQLRAGAFEVAGAVGVQVEGDAVVVHGFRAGREEGAAAGAQGQVVGAAHGVRPAVVVGVRDAGDPGVTGADGGLDVVRGGQVADGPVAVPGAEPGQGAQPGGRGGEAAAAQVEDGERPLGECRGQAQATGEGVRPCARGAFAAEVRVSGERREHGQGRLQMTGAVVLTGGVGLPQRIRRGGLAGPGASGPEVGVRTELHRLRHGHRGAPSPGGGGRTDGRGGRAGVVAEEQGGDPGVDQNGGITPWPASPGRRLQQVTRVLVPPVERRHEPAQRPWRDDPEPVGNPRGLAQAT